MVHRPDFADVCSNEYLRQHKGIWRVDSKQTTVSMFKEKEHVTHCNSVGQ